MSRTKRTQHVRQQHGLFFSASVVGNVGGRVGRRARALVSGRGTVEDEALCGLARCGRANAASTNAATGEEGGGRTSEGLLQLGGGEPARELGPPLRLRHLVHLLVGRRRVGVHEGVPTSTERVARVAFEFRKEVKLKPFSCCSSDL